MKKLLLLIALALTASATVVTNTTVGTGTAYATAYVNGDKAEVDTRVTSLRQDVGFESNNIRTVVYIQTDKYQEKMISSTESNAVSYGFEIDYIKSFDNGIGFYVGGLMGLGSKDLGSNGDLLGVSNADFRDMAVRSGVTYSVDSWLFSAGIENKLRTYDDMEASGIVLELDENIISVTLMAGYRF